MDRRLKENIGPGVDEIRSVLSIRRRSGMPDTLHLLGNFAQRSIFRKAIFQIAAHSARLYRSLNRSSNLAASLAVTALDIDRHRQINGLCDSGQIVNCKV